MDSRDFLVEEYKQVLTLCSQFHASYTRIEHVVFAGVFVIYGFLLINLDKIPSVVWWAVPILISLAAFRCFQYYWVIHEHYVCYLQRLETEIYEGRFPGFHTLFAKQAPSRRLYLALNGITWSLLIGGSIAAAVWRSARPLQPPFFE